VPHEIQDSSAYTARTVVQMVRWRLGIVWSAAIDALRLGGHARAMSEFALWDVDHWSLDGLTALDWRVAPGPVAALLFALLSHLLTG
jgi:hypothetical protein